MKIQLNRRSVEVEGDVLTVRLLLDRMNFSFPLIIVKVNGLLVPRDDYGKASVHEGDRVEVIHLMSGS